LLFTAALRTTAGSAIPATSPFPPSRWIRGGMHGTPVPPRYRKMLAERLENTVGGGLQFERYC
jgi:hypothetical protein